MAFGITTTGFNKKTLADIQAETEADLRAELGANIQLDDRDPLAQIKGILDERESILWDALEDIYNNLANVNGASGVPLDNLVALNGITRRSSSVDIRGCGTWIWTWNAMPGQPWADRAHRRSRRRPQGHRPAQR